MTCKDAMAALVASIETGDSLTHEQREHLKNCPDCRALLVSAKQVESALQSEPPQPPQVNDAHLHDKLRSNARSQFLRRGGIVLLVSIAVASLLGFAVATLDDHLDWRDGLFVTGVTALVTSIPAILFYAVIAALHDRHGNRIYKRLKDGRLLSGVCLGLAESTGIQVNVFRWAFIILAFFQGLGIWLYIVLDLAMPVHPDDRRNLLQFRIRRWFQERKNAGANVR